jgi:hypothetical protein
MPNPAASPQGNAAAANMQARQLILGNAVDMWLPIASGAIAAVGNTINVPVRNVGLIKRLVIEISGNIAQSAAETHNLTEMGGANVLSNVTFTDLSNQQRINTPGWHLTHLATARRQMAFGAAFTSDTPFGYGAKFNVQRFTSAVTAIQPFKVFVEVPISYGDFDLRGAIYAGVVNATMNLAFTINPNFDVATGADATLAVYQSTTAALANITGLTYTVYQNFLDQLPMTSNGPVLPGLDLATAYLLNSTVLTPLVNGQDNPVPYSNFRNFLSTIAILNNNGVLGSGGDVVYWALQSANFTNIWKADPFLVKLWEREIINDDFPRGVYYFDHRKKPISTVQYGNMQLLLNPTGLNAAAQLLVGWEALAIISQITNAGSLYGV